MKSFFYSATFGAILLLSGCQNLNKKVLPPEFKEKVNDVQLTSIIPQKMITANIKGSNFVMIGIHFGLAGGVLSAMIDSLRDEKTYEETQKRLQPLKETFEDFDFRQLFHETILNNVEQFDWLNIHEQSLVESGSQIQLKEGDLYLKVYLDYRLSSDFSTLQVLSEVSLNKALEKGNSSPKEMNFTEERIAGNVYRYVSPSISLVEKTDEEYKAQVQQVEEWYQEKLEEFESGNHKNMSKGNFLGKLNHRKRNKMKKVRKDYTLAESNLKMAELWSKNEGRLIKTYLADSAREISKMVLMDFSDTQKSNPYNNYQRGKKINFFQNGFQLLVENEDRVIVKYLKAGSALGHLCSLNKNEDGEKCLYAF